MSQQQQKEERSSVNDIQVETSTCSSKRNSLGGFRRPNSISSFQNLTTNNRYSRNSSMGDYGMDYDNEQNEDWEIILQQYDRYSEEDKRKSKRASNSRFQESSSPVVEVPKPEEPTFILDCYDFPPAFKTHHLHDIFRSYENNRGGGYKIKWLGDTRALIIFDSPATAKKAYIDNVTHSLAKIRPYDGPTDILKDQQRPNRPTSMDFNNKRQSFTPSRSSSINVVED